MDNKEISGIRRYLGKTQGRMSQLLGVSLKAVQSFEQGWRKIPTHIERQALFLLAMKKWPAEKAKPCWKRLKCPMETRRNCPAWEFRAGHLCWFINGTICHGEIQESWLKKMRICQQCAVFQAMFPPLPVRRESSRRDALRSDLRGTRTEREESMKKPTPDKAPRSSYRR